MGMHYAVVFFGHSTANIAWKQPDLSEWQDGSFQQQTNQERWSVPVPVYSGGI